jgi:hypothetical protein
MGPTPAPLFYTAASDVLLEIVLGTVWREIFLGGDGYEKNLICIGSMGLDMGQYLSSLFPCGYPLWVH